ncbi:MAG: hypothetical protein KDA99_01025, partial [Planctomycetales bacterium]|nr:hypothetical protein [Planctomycetales bacterium]
LRCNLELVELEAVEAPEDIEELRELLQMHQQLTGSTVAEKVLNDWPESLAQFVKVMPREFKKVLQERRKLPREMETSHS